MTSSQWWTVPQPRPQASHRLLCFPHAGGSPVAYAGWPPAVPPQLELHILQLPGRADRIGQPLIDQMPALMDALLPSVRPLLDRPVIVFGHSMGGHIALALLQTLRSLRLSMPVHLFVAASRPQHLVPPRLRHSMSDLELLAEVRALGGTPEALLRDPEFRALILTLMRADFRLFETWRPAASPPLDIPITALASPEDVSLTPADMEPWRQYTRGDFAVESFAGGHFFVHTALPQVITVMRRRLAATGCNIG